MRPNIPKVLTYSRNFNQKDAFSSTAVIESAWLQGPSSRRTVEPAVNDGKVEVDNAG